MRLQRQASVVPVLMAIAAAACASKKPLSAIAPPPPSAPEGKTSFNYIFDPSNPALGLPADVQFVRPHPKETTSLPRYPERALAARDGPHHEIVRIVIDAHGSVSQVLDSPMGRSDDGPFAAEYRRAVEEAVRGWRYDPGTLRRVEDGPDHDGDGKPDYKIMTSSETVAVYYDIRFTFEIVDGQGVVTANP